MAVTRKAPARKQSAARKPAAPSFPKFEIPEISDASEALGVLDDLIEFVGLRKGMAQDANKTQYWNGQGQALRQLRNLVIQLVPESEDEEGAA
jgi:hypothetical protein